MKIGITFCMLCFALTMHAQSIAGVWNTGQENTKIEITEKSGVYSGKLVASDNAKAKIGALLIKDVKSVGGEWEGKMYSPKKGKWYNATLEEKGGQLLVTVKSGWMSKTVEWKKDSL